MVRGGDTGPIIIGVPTACGKAAGVTIVGTGGVTSAGAAAGVATVGTGVTTAGAAAGVMIAEATGVITGSDATVTPAGPLMNLWGLTVTPGVKCCILTLPLVFCHDPATTTLVGVTSIEGGLTTLLEVTCLEAGIPTLL